MTDIVDRLRHIADLWEPDEKSSIQLEAAAEIERLRAALAARADGHSQWRPIETAPHETLVLLYSPPAWPSEAKCEVGFASTGRRTPAPDGGIFSNMSWHGYATHWMPLPFPPDSTEAS